MTIGQGGYLKDVRQITIIQEKTEHNPSPTPSSDLGWTTYFDIEEIDDRIAQIIEKEHNRTPEGIKYTGQRIDAYLNQCYKD